jgi:hypothetical protein
MTRQDLIEKVVLTSIRAANFAKNECIRGTRERLCVCFRCQCPNIMDYISNRPENSQVSYKNVALTAERIYPVALLQLASILCYNFIMEFLEDLSIPNKTCPPAEAASGRYIVYRLVDNIPLKVEDIWSYHALYPAKVFKDECIARSCSVFTDWEDLKGLQKMPKFKEKKIVVINIEGKDGVLLKTFKKSHHSWWISREFDLAVVKEAV